MLKSASFSGPTGKPGAFDLETAMRHEDDYQLVAAVVEVPSGVCRGESERVFIVERTLKNTHNTSLVPVAELASPRIAAMFDNMLKRYRPRMPVDDAEHARIHDVVIAQSRRSDAV